MFLSRCLSSFDLKSTRVDVPQSSLSDFLLIFGGMQARIIDFASEKVVKSLRKIEKDDVKNALKITKKKTEEKWESGSEVEGGLL
jgi:L-2-hydroxyglutarate oxidase LhgO